MKAKKWMAAALIGLSVISLCLNIFTVNRMYQLKGNYEDHSGNLAVFGLQKGLVDGRGSLQQIVESEGIQRDAVLVRLNDAIQSNRDAEFYLRSAYPELMNTELSDYVYAGSFFQAVGQYIKEDILFPMQADPQQWKIAHIQGQVEPVVELLAALDKGIDEERFVKLSSEDAKAAWRAQVEQLRGKYPDLPVFRYYDLFDPSH
ncbi:hypothetical protein [Paenibacillus sp. MMS18-CY102]|uniref:hypothetical protein n=1 Tax=Paenibacillus sp. MMS18-CY102 TaxID=2682849 RepID=UPI001365DE4C|nr:hypothetical protein [Paenibacillus sp. MMS18-CY102]MWC31071.1 hypothetical protein [Paenibacillus sp. MMS18-CY102]